MIPEIDIGPLTLQTFGVMFALSFVASGLIVARRLKELDLPVDWAYEFVIAAAIGGLVGAKLWFSVQEGDWSLEQVVSGSGLVWYGGAFGGALAVLLYTRWRGFGGWTATDIAAPALAAGYAVGRIGCQLSGDGDYGEPWDGPWAMGYPDGTVPTPPGVTVHPTPVYETLTMGVVALLLWRWRDRFAPGVLFGIYLVLAGAARFLVEFVRRNDDYVAGITIAQLTSLALIAIGAAVIAGRRSRAVPAAAHG